MPDVDKLQAEYNLRMRQVGWATTMGEPRAMSEDCVVYILSTVSIMASLLGCWIAWINR